MNNAKRAHRRRLLRLFGRCHWCGIRLDDATATLDHRIPTSRGGSRGTENIVLACDRCNGDKADRMPDEFLASRATDLRHQILRRFVNRPEA